MAIYSQNTESKRSLDNLIDSYKTILTNNLWTSYTYTAYGRAYLIDGFPKSYVSGNEYKEVLANDKLDASSFFFLKDSNNNDGTNPNNFDANIDLHFYVDIAKVYSTLSYRGDENVVSDAFRIVNEMTDMKITKIVRGFNAYSDFNVNEQDLKYNQPFCIFKFETILNYLIY